MPTPAPERPRRAGVIERALLALLRAAVHAYRLVISPALGPRCRHLPTCSAYLLEALDAHGLRRGIVLGLKRVARCHPWGTHGHDPVPPASS